MGVEYKDGASEWGPERHQERPACLLAPASRIALCPSRSDTSSSANELAIACVCAWGARHFYPHSLVPRSIRTEPASALRLKPSSARSSPFISRGFASSTIRGFSRNLDKSDDQRRGCPVPSRHAGPSFVERHKENPVDNVLGFGRCSEKTQAPSLGVAIRSAPSLFKTSSEHRQPRPKSLWDVLARLSTKLAVAGMPRRGGHRCDTPSPGLPVCENPALVWILGISSSLDKSETALRASIRQDMACRTTKTTNRFKPCGPTYGRAAGAHSGSPRGAWQQQLSEGLSAQVSQHLASELERRWASESRAHRSADASPCGSPHGASPGASPSSSLRDLQDCDVTARAAAAPCIAVQGQNTWSHPALTQLTAVDGKNANNKFK